ncbi:carboxypeptidase-like regulatory domain-containing protein [Sediminibacterium soli]|uniref:carboxypeptidase-like regulatory domain-containing protein n=1 Tax=Sediminibacterium soli TaxID=2698829 RepID=UPI0013799911|nr:carboxypeptidase-like regulatory domain-containing protein [Sediminibacterium soli]NCI47446.1 carboxypeptidase-like regulatory domain-containing protein [Sediminibacterium soli]
MRKALAALLVLFTLTASAQKKTVWGYLRDSATHEIIPLASVTNLSTGRTVMTGNNGRFSIELSPNQLLSFAAVGYHFDTVYYNNKHAQSDTLTLYLSSLAHNLGNVTVTSRAVSRYQSDSIERRRFFLQGKAEYKIPTVAKANSGAGIALNLDRFSRHEREKRKAFDLFDTNEKEAYINYRFPGSLVTGYSGLKGDDLRQFMQQYRPSAGWLRSHTDEEDIKYYINDRLKEFKKRGVN